MEEGARDGDISTLPESCIAHALSLTSPRDACRSALVSAAFRRAADSDTVWDRFLPPDHREILSRAVCPPTFSSKKELYFRLCDPILIDGGKMVTRFRRKKRKKIFNSRVPIDRKKINFSQSCELERPSGKKCFMISARQLVIVWGDNPRYWRWISSSDSRFSEVAELVAVCWLEIRGKIDVSVLSPKTTYCAYLVFKIAERSNGLGFPAEASVKVGTHGSECHASLTLNEQSNVFMEHQEMVTGPTNLRVMHPKRVDHNMTGGQASSGTEQVLHEREGEWLKLEMGEFFVDEGNEGEVDISLVEGKGGHWKRGLIVQGIEVRPKK